MPKISVIIPIYNVEEYLVQCLDSVLAQTFRDFEVICVNDGSTDLSGEILKGYAETDSRIKVINKENEGVSIARNKGLDIAKGEYIVFVDSDDWLELNCLEETYNYSQKNNSDLCVFGFSYVKENIKIVNNDLDKIGITNFNFYDAPRVFFCMMTGCLGKLWKRDKITIPFEKIAKSEDTLFFWKNLLKNNHNISILNQSFYNYFQRPNSSMNDINLMNDCLIFESCNRLCEFPEFLSANSQIQVAILERYAQSIWWEMKTLHKRKIRIKKNYYKEVQKFVAKFSSYLITDVENCYYFKVLQELNFKKKTIKKNNIFNLIKEIQKKQKYYPKDTYLLFDCLFDSTTECIDAYSLFDYMRDNGFKAYYVVLRQSQLYKKLQQENKLENVIVLPREISPDNEYELFEAIKTILLRTKCVLTSFSDKIPVANRFFKGNKYILYVFLQHGMTFSRDSVLTNYMYPEQFDKFLISANIEEKLFKKYSYADSKLIKSCLPRWDLYNNTRERSILIMFTWRRLTPEKFEKSLYKKNLLALIHNDRFINFAKENNIKLYFAPHHALKTNSKINFEISSPYIEVIDTQNISQYIRKCSCLITDFSSVAYDFIFQNKPAIFYPLDKGCECLNEMEKEDLERFNYKQYILANVFNSIDEVVDKAIYYIKNNFVLEKHIKEKYEGFFFIKENIRENLTNQLEKITVALQELVKNLPFYKKKYLLSKILSFVTYGKLKEKFRQQSDLYKNQISVFRKKAKIKLKRYSLFEHFVSKKEKTTQNGDKVVHYRLFGVSLFKSVQKHRKNKYYYLFGIKVA